MSTESSDARLHREVWEALPWLVNGSADEVRQAHAMAHIARCESCKEEYLHQRRLQEALALRPAAPARGPDLEAGLARLMQQLPPQQPAGLPAQEDAAAPQPAAAPAQPALRPRRVGWLGAVALAQAAALAAVALSPWLQQRQPAAYQTLSTPAPAPATAAPRWRVLPAEDMSLGEWRALLESQQLLVRGGPNGAGAWELASRDAGADAQQTLARLRQQPRLRLVEPIEAP